MALSVPNLNMQWGIAPQINPQDMLAGFTGLPRAIAEYRVRQGIDKAVSEGRDPGDSLLRFADSQGIGTGYQTVAQREMAEAAQAEADMRDGNAFFKEQYGRQNTANQQARIAMDRLTEFRNTHGNNIAANPALQAQEAELIKQAEEARNFRGATRSSLIAQAEAIVNDPRQTKSRRDGALAILNAAKAEPEEGLSAMNPYTAQLNRSPEQEKIKSIAEEFKGNSDVTRNEAEKMLAEQGLPITAANIDELHKGLNERASANAAAQKAAYEKSMHNLNLATGSENYKRAKFSNQDAYEKYVVETNDYKDNMSQFEKAAKGSLLDKLNWLNAMGTKLTLQELEGPNTGLAGIINKALSDPNSVTEQDAKKIVSRFMFLGRQENNRLNARIERLEGN